MFDIEIIAIGKLKEESYKALEKNFLKMTKPFAKVKVTELPHVPFRKFSQKEACRRETEQIISHLNKLENYFSILLDERGESMTSSQLASFLKEKSSQKLVFIIGGSLGVESSLRKKVNFVWSLSLLTFPHKLVRLLLEEQLYRSMAIIFGKKYHH